MITAVLLPAVMWTVPPVSAQTVFTLFEPGNGSLPQLSQINPGSRLEAAFHEALNAETAVVSFQAGDSFGLTNPTTVDWSRFDRLSFSAYNPGNSEIRLSLVLHISDRLRASPPRASQMFTLSPGLNRVRLDWSGFSSNAGEPIDFSRVLRWSVSSLGIPSTLYFTSFLLESDRVSPTPPRTASNTGQATQNPPVAPLSPDSGTQSGEPPLAAMPQFDMPVMFNTPLADQIVSVMQIYPRDNAINTDISDWPVSESSAAMITAMGADAPLRYNPDMAFILVPPDQPRVDVVITAYPDESDPGPYPVPSGVPIEGWPVMFTRGARNLLRTTLEEVQRAGEGDRHAIVVDPVNRVAYEFYRMFRSDDGWTADQASIFDLTTNTLRPDGWTSSDAAGLPLFPLVVRYDELASGEIRHALRVTFPRTRRAYVAPATHYASRSNDPNLPRMGERIRLRDDFDTRSFSTEVRIILDALKKYGMLVADNGIAWAISVTPDERIPDLHSELRRIRGSDFEVVVAP